MAQEKTDSNLFIDLANVSSLEELKKQAIHCDLCKLIKIRSRLVFGAGNEKAKIIFIGEAPGATEEAQGLPFVGRAGKLLNLLLETIDIKRTDIYITNILKCRPPNNRVPLPWEIKLCLPYLYKEISLINPKVIVTLGRIAAQSLLNTAESIERLRKNIYQYGPQKIAVLATYHPAYLLRASDKTKEAHADFLKIKELLTS